MKADVNPPKDAFLQQLAASLEQGSFVRLLLSHPTGGAADPQRILGRLIDLRGQPHLSLTSRHATRDLTRNLPVTEAVAWARETLGAQFRSALLGTTTGDWQLSLKGRDRGRLVRHPPARTAVPARQHDLPTSSFLDDRARPWLQALGLADATGRIRASMADKHRQVHHYLELLSHLVRELGWAEGQARTVVDMGCGKGYLTFGAWHLLRQHLRIPARVIGVESRPDLAAAAERVARTLAAEGLEFQAGTIAEAALPAPDALVALHACNTATDDALRRGVAAGAGLILVAPCCHRELRPQLQAPEWFAPLLHHGLFRERFAEWLTDGLRVLHLETLGYDTRVLEFVASEHTPRNVLIAALRRPGRGVDLQRQQQIRQLKEAFGVHGFALDALPEPP